MEDGCCDPDLNRLCAREGCSAQGHHFFPSWSVVIICPLLNAKNSYIRFWEQSCVRPLKHLRKGVETMIITNAGVVDYPHDAQQTIDKVSSKHLVVESPWRAPRYAKSFILCTCMSVARRVRGHPSLCLADPKRVIIWSQGVLPPSTTKLTSYDERRRHTKANLVRLLILSSRPSSSCCSCSSLGGCGLL